MAALAVSSGKVDGNLRNQQDTIEQQLRSIIDVQNGSIGAQADEIGFHKQTINFHKETINDIAVANARLRVEIDRRETRALEAEVRMQYQEDALRETAVIRDAQEDKLDAKTEELDRLAAEHQNLVTAHCSMAQNVANQEREIQDLKRANKRLQTESVNQRKRESKQRVLVRSLRAQVSHLQQSPMASKPESSKEDDPAVSWTDKQLCQCMIDIGRHDVATQLLESARNLDRLQAVDREWMYKEHQTSKDSSRDNDLMKSFIKRAGAAEVQTNPSPEAEREHRRVTDWTDEKPYAAMVKIRRHDLAAELLETAINVDCLRGIDRVWVYKKEEADDGSSADDDSMNKFIKCAVANGIRVIRN
ncbi:hypothetical protein F5B20DRAFT_594288 [Whalleya microplaca]|nr:hypothetical protein F5B20DRAFT_594288 [Whalleya microplaca]